MILSGIAELNGEAPMPMPEWNEIGIPDGFGPYRLLYNPPSETVIIELRPIGENFLPNQLFFRKKDVQRYEPVNHADSMTSTESVVTSLERPLLFYLSNKLTKRDRGYAGDLIGSYSFDLQKEIHVQLADKTSLGLPPPYVDGWVTGLVDVSSDATQLYLTVGMMEPDTAADFQSVNHQLARMDLQTGNIHLVSYLQGAFF